MIFDEFDIKILVENFSEDLVSQIDLENLKNIFNYLNENGVYYAKDLLLTSLDLFLLPHEIFIKKFEVLKNKLGENFIDDLGENSSLIEIMYE